VYNFILKGEISSIFQLVKREIRGLLKNNLPSPAYQFILGLYHYLDNQVFKIKLKIYLLVYDLPVKIDYENINNNMIAHAGGAVSGDIYTNSKNALKRSLNKGLVKVEFDMGLTKNQTYVAVNDWVWWAERVNYDGILPPDDDTFRQLKIDGKYESIFLKDIEEALAANEHLTIFIDKIENAEAFCKNNKYNERYVLEIFDANALDITQVCPTLRLILSEVVLEEYKYDYERVEGLVRNRNVIGFAASLGNIRKEIEFFAKSRNNGLEVFAFGLNKDGRNFEEMLVLCDYKLLVDYIYADNIDDSPVPLTCS